MSSTGTGKDESPPDPDTYGSIDNQDLVDIRARLSRNEYLSIIAGLNIDEIPGITKDEGKKLIVVTNHRLLAYSSQDIRLLGEKNTFSDIDIDSIKEVDVEERKGFDRITVTTNRNTQSFMAPEKVGVKITGRIRELQEQSDPINEIKRLSKQHEEGNITDEEYETKKTELLDRV